MALTRIDLSIELETATDCSDILLTDDTGTYPTAPEGYGLTGGIVAGDVTSLIITVNMGGGIYFTYTFNLSHSTIISCLLSINGGTGTDITAVLNSTYFPLVDFSLFGDYGVTLPSLEDGVVEVDYNISGVSGSGESFNYLTSEEALVVCSTCCCIERLGLSIDPLCDCSENAMMTYLRASTYLEIAGMNAEIGNMETAQAALDKASGICNCGGCSDC
jgi:hypothetical protein